MAPDPKSRQVIIHWEQTDGSGAGLETGTGSLQVAIGTLEFLGINADDIVIGEISYEVGQLEVSRQLYPDGPVATYTRPAQTIKRLSGSSVSTAKAGKPMFLETGDGTTDTIRVTGNRRLFAKWLKSKVNVGALGTTLVLKNYNKTTYAVLHEAPAT